MNYKERRRRAKARKKSREKNAKRTIPCHCKYCPEYYAGISNFVKHLKAIHDIDVVSAHVEHIPKNWLTLDYTSKEKIKV